METLGHSRIALTMNTYAHVFPRSSGRLSTRRLRRCSERPRLYFLAVRHLETLPMCSASLVRNGRHRGDWLHDIVSRCLGT